MSRLDTHCLAELDRLAQAGLRRTLAETTHPKPGRAERAGQSLLNFSGNDYLGLSHHPALAARAADYANRYGTGAGASRLICGTLPAHTALETRLAALKGTQAAMLMASGWQANTAVLAALLRLTGPTTQLFTDELSHNSLLQGARLAGIRPTRFAHNNMADLTAKLTTPAAGPRIIATESVFSMDGDRADLPALRALAETHNVFLYLDEAHATGVLGANGMGLGAHMPGIDLLMGTASKALGSFGAYIAGSRALIDYLQNACAGFIYTTALPPPLLGAIDAALDLIPTMDAERAHLATQSNRVRTALAALGIDTGASTTQIIPAMVGDAQSALDLAAALRARGVLAVAIRPPTVPPGTSRLRIALSAAHTAADVDALIDATAAVWPRSRLAV